MTTRAAAEPSLAELTLFDVLRAQAQRAPHAFALLAPGRRPLTYAALLAQLQHTVAQLLVFGVGRGDRVAVVVNNGPEQATALLGTASGAVCAPLSPGFTAAEFSSYLARLGPRALIVDTGQDTAVAAARALGITVLELVPSSNAPAGTFTLQGPLRPLSGQGGGAQPEDAALLLHTSGTTAQPKLVPLSHRHLLLSTANLQPVLRLSAADRNLNVLPFYHIHGFMSGLLLPLSRGASVVCTPGFSAGHFLGWLAEYQPTWYSVSPALHQAILALATEKPAAVPLASLRFVRSGSAPLPLAVIQALENTLHVPVIEGYGMTEVNPISSNPRPPQVRKQGSVGLPAGPEVRIMAPVGASLLPPGAVGEVVVRGPTVIAGYAGDPLANVESFTGDWLRTGDQGYLDEDGYLFITGRLKEVINRGGDKISPGEVEAALLAHPAVAEAVVFALPDARLGEAVGAAVVLWPEHAAPDEPALRQFAAERLAEFKVPRRIVSVEALPKGPTGKVLRVGLADRLNIQAHDDEQVLPGYAAPAGLLENRLAALWREVLGRAQVGRHDRFLDLGGDSLLATQLVARVAEAFGLELNLVDFLEAPTLAEQAALLELLGPRRDPLLDDTGERQTGSL
jgi:oxalate---CoA ligase